MIVHDNNDFEIIGLAHPVINIFAANANLAAINPNQNIKIGGKYRRPYISEMKIEFGNTKLSGKFDGRTFNMHTPVLNMDEISNPEWMENYDSLKFTNPEPITVLFDLGAHLTLSADKVIFRRESYDKFTYSLGPGSQNMSITDNQRGSVIISIDKRGSNYNMSVSANKFELTGTLLPESARLNVADTQISGRATLSTNGMTANDFWRNIRGDAELMFDGGILIGFDTDKLYDSVADISRMNGEFMIAGALSGGMSRLISLRLVGNYEGGTFRTTEPLTARTRHTEFTGHLQSRGGRVRAQLRILMRGTSPVPEPVSIEISGGGGRDFSLSEIMRTFDPDFMREFTRINNRF
jgi:hypothetical protein